MCSLTFSILMAWVGILAAAPLMIWLLILDPQIVAGASAVRQDRSRQ
jgi:hypothetical protein